MCETALFILCGLFLLLILNRPGRRRYDDDDFDEGYPW
jgi:hypothetical protein